MLDERAIVEVALRYCRALDTKDWSALADVFVEDATASLGGRDRIGLEQITKRCRAALGELDLSQHMVSNHEVDVDGDSATHSCYLHAQHVREDTPGGSLYVVAGRYEDRLARTPDGWRIAHRQLVVMWTDGNVEVVERPRSH